MLNLKLLLSGKNRYNHSKNGYVQDQDSIVDSFHKLYFYSRVWTKTTWLGTPVLKCPLDLWIYQELVFAVKPDVIIECGTAYGGSAKYLASIFDLVGKGRVISVDINTKIERPMHPRITYIAGSSVSDEIVERVKKLINVDEVVMVVLDSDHRKNHVLKELSAYGKLVTKGSYLVVEDSSVNNHPILPDFGEGPMEALEEFLRVHDEFIIDKSLEKFFLTFNPNGYLKRVS